MPPNSIDVNHFYNATKPLRLINQSYFSYFYRVMHSYNELGFSFFFRQDQALSILGVYHNQGNIMKMRQLALLLLSFAMLGGFATGCAKSDEDKAKEAVEEAADAVKEAAE